MYYTYMGVSKNSYNGKVTLSIDDDYKARFKAICEYEYTDMSKQLRKWIDKEYPQLNK